MFDDDGNYLFIRQIAYSSAEEMPPPSCFSEEQTQGLELQVPQLEGNIQKLKNPDTPSDLERYIWVIARTGDGKVIFLNGNRE